MYMYIHTYIHIYIHNIYIYIYYKTGSKPTRISNGTKWNGCWPWTPRIWCRWPLTKLMYPIWIWPPGLLAPNHQALTDAMFWHHCDPLVVLSHVLSCASRLLHADPCTGNGWRKHNIYIYIYIHMYTCECRYACNRWLHIVICVSALKT